MRRTTASRAPTAPASTGEATLRWSASPGRCRWMSESTARRSSTARRTSDRPTSDDMSSETSPAEKRTFPSTVTTAMAAYSPIPRSDSNQVSTSDRPASVPRRPPTIAPRSVGSAAIPSASTRRSPRQRSSSSTLSAAMVESSRSRCRRRSAALAP